jgi:uncharacterized protein DUF2637
MRCAKRTFPKSGWAVRVIVRMRDCRSWRRWAVRGCQAWRAWPIPRRRRAREGGGKRRGHPKLARSGPPPGSLPATPTRCPRPPSQPWAPPHPDPITTTPTAIPPDGPRASPAALPLPSPTRLSRNNWLWPVVIDGTIVVALLTVLAAKRATAQAAYPWALAGPFSLASVAFNIAHAPDQPVAQLVFAMAPVALVLNTHLLMQQAGWRRATSGPTEPVAEHDAGPEPAHSHRPGDHPAPEPASPDRGAQVAARARVRAAYEAQLTAGQTPTGAGLAVLTTAAGVSERYGQRLLAEYTSDPTPAGHPNGDSPARTGGQRHDPTTTEGR